MTRFHWLPDDVDHYLAMQGAVAQLVTPNKGEHHLIAERCGTTRIAVLSWRRNHGIPSLHPEPPRLAAVDKCRKGRGPAKGEYRRDEYRKNGAAINGVPYSAPMLLSEDEFTVLMDDRMFEDDPRGKWT